MTIQESQDKIIDEFKFIKDNGWIGKYNYLVKLGQSMPPIDTGYKTDDKLLESCQVKVWFHSSFNGGKVFYDIDSSSAVIKGIIFLLIKVLSGQSPQDIEDADLYFINKTGLDEICSRDRINTFHKIVNQMKLDASLYNKI
jgi:cysteine desulfuration protein SufE